MARYFAVELQRLMPLVDGGLVTLEPRAIQVTPLGWHFVCELAMVFDRYLQSDLARTRCSQVI